MSFRIDLVYLAVTAALALRFAVLAATLPFLDQRSVPFLWRVALAVVVALACAPVVRAETPLTAAGLTWGTVLIEAARSLLVGAFMSFAVGMLFLGAKYAGQITGMQIGFAIVNTIDPQTGGQVSILSELYYLLSALLFFAVDGHHMVMSALIHACTVVPLFSPVNAAAGAWHLVGQYGLIFQAGLQIAAPCVIVLLLVSATMGVIVKTVPQINVLVVGFPIKIGVGLAVVGFSLVFFNQVFLSLLQRMEGQLVGLFEALI